MTEQLAVALQAMPEHSVADAHLSAEEMAAYVDRTLSVDQRVRAESHLVACAECRQELAASSRLVSTLPPTTTRRNLGRLTGFALAAGILLAVVLTRPGDNNVPVQRRSEIDAVNRVQTVFPAISSTVDGKSLTFTWRRDDDATYQVSLVDSAGAVVWATATSDTVVRLPQSVPLEPGARYFWYVDALRADGFSLSSGPVEFKTAK